MKVPYCKWYKKPLKDIYEYEQDECIDSCEACECMVMKECDEENE